MRLIPDSPIGEPSFGLSGDEIATVIDLACRGAEEARKSVTPGMREVPISIILRKAMRIVKAALGHTNIEVRGEHELEDMAKSDPSLLGRIDVVVKFATQFGDEDDYVAIECKRIGGAGEHAYLNSRYVTQGVHRFVTGQYALRHRCGFMVGYVLSMPLDKILAAIDGRLRSDYGENSGLQPGSPHPCALDVRTSWVCQNQLRDLALHHLFVDMLPAA